MDESKPSLHPPCEGSSCTGYATKVWEKYDGQGQTMKRLLICDRCAHAQRDRRYLGGGGIRVYSLD